MKRHADTTGLRRVLGSRIVLMLRVKFRRTRTCTALIPSQAEDARYFQRIHYFRLYQVFTIIKGKYL